MATGGMSGGALSMVVPAGWTAPQSGTASAAGYVTATSNGAAVPQGNIAVSGSGPWTITVSSLSPAATQHVVITYGDTSGGGSGVTATATTGANTWTIAENSTAGTGLVNIAAFPATTVYAANGSGTLTTVTTKTSASSTANTVTFTYTAATGGLSGGAVSVDVPAGWTAPQTGSNSAAGYTTSSAGTLSVSGQTITVSSLTLAGAATLTITYGDTTGGTQPGAAAVATSSTGAQTWQGKENSIAGTGLANLGASPSVTVYAGDGSGTLSANVSNVSASSTGNSITFTFTAATGGTSNGAVSVDVPAGWTAPQTSTNTAAGYTTASAGSVAVVGQTITVSSLTLAGAATLTITYGNTTGGTQPGAAAVATSSTGAQAWQGKENSTASTGLANLGASPSITVNAADGAGTMSVSPTTVLAGTANTETFTFTAPAGGISNGSVTIDVPAGWTAPQTSAGAGQTTSTSGSVSVAGQTITVSSLTLTGAATATITYAGGVAPTATGSANWTSKERSTNAGGALANVAVQPSVTVNNAADGSGVVSISPSPVLAGTTNTMTMTFTAPTGGMTNGAVSVDVPAGWTAPQLAAGAGQVTSDVGSIAVAGQTITVSSLSRNAGQTMTITYAGGVATTSTGSAQWTTKQKSTSGGTLTNLAAQQSVTVNNAADGSGTAGVSGSPVLAGTADTLTFTYTAPTGGMTNGAVTVDVPAGWTAPQTAAGAGQVTSSAGSVSVASQTATVSSVSLNAGQTLTITYTNGVAPTTTGSANWTTKQKSTSSGTLTSLAAQPSVTVNNAADGSGTAGVSGSPVLAGTTNTLTFTFTAPTGGMTNGAVSLDVPAGWTAPQTGAGAGQVMSDVGSVSVSGQTITVSSLSRNAGQTMTITYANGVATTTTGSATWTTKEQSTSGGTLTSLGAQPSVAVNNAADGSGVVSVSPSPVLAGTTNTMTMTFTAPTGGMTNGAVTVDVPAGWTAPQTGAGAGQVTSDVGSVSVSGQTITVSSLSRNAGQTMTITYANGVATTTTGSATWTTKEKSTSGGVLTNLASQQSVTVNNAADGSGVVSVSPSPVLAGTTQTITMTFTAPTGGMTNGAVTVDVPAGWTAPQTSAGAGQVTSDVGSVSVSGQTITVSSLSRNAGQTMTITYANGVVTTSTGAATWTTKQKSTSGGTLANVAAQPSVTVNNAGDGTGTVGVAPANVLAGTANTETLTFTAPTGGMTNGAVTVDVPAGWTAPQLAAGAGQVTSDVGSVFVAGQTITVSSLSRNAGQTMTITYAGGLATTTTGAANWTTKEKSTSGGTLTNVGAQPAVTVNNAADGTGTVSISPASVLAGTTNTETITFTAPTGGMTNGAVSVDVPAGWTAPQTSAGAGQVTSDVGSVSVAGQTITVSSLSRNAGQTMTLTYAGGVATTTAGAAQWTTKEKSTSGGALTNVAAQQSVTVINAADGTGTIGVSPTTVLAGTSNTETFTYTTPTGGMTNGAITIDVPAGWTAPQTGAGAGQVTSDAGSVSVSGQTLTVSSLSKNAGDTVTITYGNGVATTTTGSAQWTTKQKSTSGGTLTNVIPQPSVTVNNAADGTGTIGVAPTTVLAGTVNSETFTFTAPTGGMTNGAITIDVPAGWTAPQTGAGAGQVTSDVGSVSVSGQTITVSSLSRGAGQTVTVTYAGGVATTTAGAATWTTKEKSTSGGTLTNVAAQPSVGVDNAADGTGTVGVAPTSALAATANTETFTFTAATGGMTNGAITIDVPAGWTAPQTSAGAGQATSSVGSVSVSGQTITVDSLNRTAGQTVTVTYAGGVATTTTGAANWTTKEKSTSGGTLSNVAAQPSVTVNNAADGSGTLTASTSSVLAASSGNTITFTYTAAPGGISNGTVTVDIPSGWTAPQTSAGAGQATSSTGSVSVSGQTITVSSLTLAAGATATITYSSATASSSTGSQAFTTQERSTTGGTLTTIAASPSVTVTNAADGSGTIGADTASVLAGSSGNTINFTYTAATGGMSSGAVELTIPTGWTAPTTSAGAGQVTSNAGSVSISGQVVTVSGVTLAAGATMTITYANATATSVTGSQTWSTRQRSTSGGSFTALSSSPSISVTNAPHGSGTMSASTATSERASTGNSITFTYTAATGGMSGGAVTLVVPSGWTAPTTSAGAGNVSATAGTVSVSGSTITVDSLTLAAGATVNITYANATAPSTNGAQTWTAQQKSTSGDTLTSLASSPSITVQDTTPPTFVSASVDSPALTLTFDEALNTGSTPAGSAFTVDQNGSAQANPTAVSVSGSTVTLTLAAPIRNGDTVTVAYTEPATNRVQDTSANAAASFGAQAVTNATASLPPNTPALVSPANGGLVNTTMPTLSASFSDTDTNNTGQLTFRVCSDSACSTVLGSFSSATGIANGANGSAAVPGGTIVGDGTYYWQAMATDNTSSSSAWSASRSFVVDTTAPVLQTAGVNGTTLTLTYNEALDASSVPAALAYGLHVNGGAAVTPTNVSISGSAVTLTFTAGTVHNGDAVTLDYTAGGSPVQDAARNAVSNLSGQAVTNSTASIAPGVPALVSPAAGLHVNTTTPSLSATFTDPDLNNTGQITFQVCSDSACSSVLATFSSASGIANGANGSATVPGGTIASDGTYYWHAKATDNTSAASAYSTSRAFVVDTTPPTFSSASVDTSSLAVVFGEPLDNTSIPAGSAFTVRVNGSAQAAPTNVSLSGSAVTLTLAAAVHNEDVVTVAYTQPATGRIKDVAGNDAASFSAQAVTNNTVSVAPNVPSLVSPADSASLATRTPSLSANFSDADTNNTGQITFRVCADSGCSTVVSLFASASGILNGANGSASVPTGDLTADGTYYWQAKATDDQGVSSAYSASRSFTVDTTPPPVPTIDSGPTGGSTSGANVSFAFSDTEVTAAFEVNLDGAGWNPATSPKAYTNLSDGSHTFQVRAHDALGNTSAPYSRTWTVDATPPPLPTIDSGPTGGSTSGPNVSFGFSDTEAGATLQIQLDGGGYSAATSPHAYASLAQGAHTFDVRASDAYGNTSAATSVSWSVDATPPTVSITNPTSGQHLAGAVSLTSSASDAGGSGLATVTYQYAPTGTSTWTTTSTSWNTTLLTDGGYDLRAIATDNAGNSTTSASVSNVTVDNTPPTVTVGAPQYVNAATPASITLGATSPDTDLAQVEFFQCSNASTDCSTGTWSSLGVDTTSPFGVSWTVPAPDGNVAVKAVATDLSGNTGSSIANVLIDRTAPAGGSVSYANGYASGSVSVTTDPGTDSGSGLDAASEALQRDETALANGTCNAFPGTWSSVSSPDSTIRSGKCYRYRYSVADKAGNVTAYTSTNVVKVDTTAPTTVSLAFSSLSNASVSGTTVYYQQGATGGFTVTASSGDPESGIASTSYPALGGGWSGSGGVYTFSASSTAPSGTQTVTVTDGAGLQSTATFTVVADTTAPSGGSISVAAGFHTLTNVDLTLADGSDAGSGVNTTSEQLQRASAAFSGGTCQAFGSFATIATAPGASYNDGTVASGNCYEYRYVVFDNVGNSVTYTSPSVVEIDANAPSGSLADPGPYLRATITLSASASDTGGSGVASVAFQRSPAGGGVWTTIGTVTSSPYDLAWDTTAVADGLYDLRVVVTDGAGNQTASAIVGSRRVDNTPPLATMTDPGPYLRATVTLTSSSSDAGSGMASVVYQYSPAGANTWTTTPAAFDTTTGTTPDGLYDLRVLVTDNAGNQTISTVTSRRIDNTPPIATMSSPGAYLRGTVSLTQSSSDPGGSGVGSVQFESSPAGASTWSPIPASWNTTGTADGLYDLHVVVTDNAGNVSTSTTISNVRVDNTPPAVAVTSPAAGADVTGTVALANNASDAGSGIQSVTYAYSPHGAATWTAMPASWDTTTVADGPYDLRATATDRAGNSTTSAVVSSITVDNTPPAVSFTSPLDSSYVNLASTNPVPLAASSNDGAGSGVASVQFFACTDTSASCSSGSWGALGTDTTAPYTASWPIPVDGQYALKVLATDNVGHTSSQVITVTVDRTPPNTTIATKPGNPSNVGAPQFTFSSTETGSTFQCQIDGGTWSACSSPDTLATLADGTHTFDVRAIDPAGNTDPTPDSWTWLVDTTPPTGTLADPGRNVRGTVTLNGSASDPGTYASGVASLVYEYSTDGSVWATTSPTWDTVGPPAVADGLYQVRIVVTDNAGNVFTSTPITNVRVDNTPPTSTMDDPGANLRGTVSLTAAASDTGSGVASVAFQAAASGTGAWSTVGTATTGPYAVSLDTTTLPDGLYDFRTITTDAAGNVFTSASVVNRRVDNTPPTATMTNPGTPLRGVVSLASSSADAGGSGVASVQYEVSNGGAYAPVAASWNTAGSADGTYSVHVVVRDVAGNVTTSAPVTGILVDNTAPNTTNDAPAGWQNAAVTVHLTPTDAGSGVSTTQYSLDGGAWMTGTTVLVPAVDGSHTIAYYSVDNAGNIETQRSATVLMQASAPSCPTCSAADYLRGTVTLTANPTTTGAPITSVKFQYNGTTIGTDTTSPYSVDWNTNLVSDGTYDLTVVVTDAAGNVSTIDLGNKVVDNTLPTAAVGAPTAGTIVGDTVSFSSVASDANLASVDYYVNGTQIGSTSGAAVNWNTTTVPDGPATLYVVATDRAGNTRTSATVSVTVANQPPTVSLTAPSAAVGTADLSATTSANTTTVEFQRSNGGAWTSIATVGTPFATTLDTTALTDGTYSLRAIATDVVGHTTTSATVTMVVDNTPPTGSITAPLAGASVGGSGVALVAAATDATSGVASVVFETRKAGTATWSTAGTATSAPWQTTWATPGLTTGSYDIRVTVTDRNGNVFRTAPITVNLVNTAPTVQLQSLNGIQSGTIALNATTGGQGAVSVAFSVAPAGSYRWTAIGTSAHVPWTTSFDTTSVPDGLYDFNAVVTDGFGNTSQSVLGSVRIDNTPPSIVAATPADGAVVTSADSLWLQASEDLAGLNDPRLDGVTIAPPVISGSHATFNTGALTPGLHILSGTLRDLADKLTPFQIHVTVQPTVSNAPGTAPAVEKNSTPTQSTTVTTADNGITVTMPAGAWPTAGGAGTNDWIVLRVDASQPPADTMPGFVPAGAVYDVTARWALGGSSIHTGFGRELVLQLPDASGKLIPAVKENGAWRIVPQLPDGVRKLDNTTLVDGFYRDGGMINILSRHLTPFTLVRDVQAPTHPSELDGTFGTDGLTLHWTPGVDNSGILGPAVVYADGQVLATAPAGQSSVNIGVVDASDLRAFTVVQADGAGNVSDASQSVRVLPDLTGMNEEQARAALIQRGFAVGTVVTVNAPSIVPGTIASPTGLKLAPANIPVDLSVSGAAPATKLAFNVVGTKTVRVTKSGVVAARISVSKPAAVVATLYSPRAAKLQIWRFKVRAGVSIVRLHLPSSASFAGRYKLVWIARSSAERISHTILVQVVGASIGKSTAPVDVVLLGYPALGNGLTVMLSRSQVRVLLASSEDPAFAFTGGTKYNVRVVVVDVDHFTLSLVHDLRVVFPSVNVIALTAQPRKLSQAVAAGASVALPRSTSTAQLARVVRRLSKP
ncbi:MAG: OmpL47-type beta-barrel domain-containing protein [Gaiellaceae bacterium]